MQSAEVVERSCPLCGAMERRLNPTWGDVIEECDGCGLVSTRLAVAEPSQPDLYDAEYYESGGYSRYFERAPLWRFIARRRLDWILSHLDAHSLVEVGAAGGFFVEAAVQRGIAAFGIDPSGEAVEYATRDLAVDCRTGTFEESSFDTEVDLVCGFHVFEHVEDPRRFLTRVLQVLGGGGYLALEVPNLASAAAANQGPAWPALQPRYHRWHFTPETLVALVHRVGFEVCQLDTAFTRMYVPPEHWVSPEMLRATFRDLWWARTFHRVHPHDGDNIRLLARTAP